MLECQADNGGCGEPELAACAELRGAAPICSDIDECATDNGGCDDGFICINHDGLQGEPNECIDRDECVGSVSVGWSVVVPLELVTVPLKTAASIAIQDPTAVGEANAATIITVGERWAQGVPASPVQSYVWVKEPAGCPSGCGNAAVTLADGYICRRDGLQVPHRFCISNLGPPPVSSVACPPTNDCHCEGGWSACTSSCRDSVFTVSRPRSGTVGNGRDCEAADAETRPCLSGQGACNPYADPSVDIDCIGDYPPCAADCGRSFYNITRMNSGTGRACSAPGTSHECTPGMGFCAPDVDCVGAWTACDGSCARTFEIAIEQSGTGQPCEAAHGDFEMCSAGDSCDDGESLTMGDVCGEEMGCSGAVTLAAALTYDIKVDPARLSVEERTALEDGLREGIASVLSAAGLEAETAAVRVVGIETVGTHECDPSARCTNEIGSYRCACNDGFAGDGFVCADIDECDVDRGGCDPRHAIAYREAESSSFSHVASVFNNSIIGYCENTPGSFHCGCVAGFELNATDEQTCHDIDECEVYPNGNCGPSLYFNCTNNLGMNATCGGGYPACPAEGEFRDCDGACFSASLSPEKLLLLGTPVPSAWLGDGWCDNGAQGVDFNCSDWHFDNGDCG